MIDKLSSEFFGIVDQFFYPDIAEARQASRMLLKAVRENETGVTLRMDERWRNRSVRRDVRFALTGSPVWYENIGTQLGELVKKRDREAIDRTMKTLAKEGSVIN